MRKAYLLLLMAVFVVQLSQAQQAKQYSFTHYGVKDGLAAYNTRSVVQDATGYIWIATLNGLQRFDGSRFLTFRHAPSDKHSLPDNYVEQLLYDKNSQLWLVLNDGSVGTFDTRTFTFHKANVLQGNQNNLQALRKLVMDADGNLIYIFPNIEALTYNKQKNEFAAVHNPFPIPLNWKIVSVIQDRLTKKYWMGTDSGMAIYNAKTKALSYTGHNVEHEAFIEKMGRTEGVNCYWIDQKSRCWFLSWPTYRGFSSLYAYDMLNDSLVLNLYNLATLAQKYVEPDNFLEQQNGSIWISGLNIFAKYDEAKKGFELLYNGSGNDHNINYKAANAYEDKEQNIWVATTDNGLYVFSPSKQLFTSYKHINRISQQQGNGYLLSFAKTTGGKILAGVWGDGLYRYDDHFTNIPLAINNIPEVNGLPVWDICVLKDKRTIWLVGQPSFIYVYDEISNTAKRYEPPIFEGKTIRQATEDRLGNIWLGSNSRGVIKWDPAKAVKKFEDGFYRVVGIPYVKVKKIITDRQGFVWVCTNKEGVYKIDPITDSIVLHLTKEEGLQNRLLSNDASAIFEYNDSLLLISTGALNIYNKKTNTVTYITSADGLPSNTIVSIEKDKYGYLWLGSMNGLCRMNLEKRTYTFFDRGDGIVNDNFQVAASYQLPDGRMLFGSSDDFVFFNPDDITTTTQPPPAIITEIKLLDKSLKVDSVMQLNRIELTAAKNSITIGFAALSYTNKSKLVYHYMLENIDQDWRKADRLNQAVYNYLPPGKYSFKVKVENADGVAAKSITTLIIRIKPPFWKTWWFLGLLTFAAIGILYWFDKFRIGRIRETESVRTRIATSLTKDMSSTLSNINILSEMARLKVERDTERTKEYITQISNNSNRMMEVMDDMIWSIDPGNDELQYTILRMKKYASEIQSKYSVDISFMIDQKATALKLDMDKRHEFFLIYKEIVLNMGVHSGSKVAAIDLRYEKGKLVLKVTDNGKGFDTEEISFGRGLNEIRKKANLLNADLDIRSEINTGTTVQLEMLV